VKKRISRHGHTYRWLITVALLLGTTACGSASEVTGEACEALSGELVITELAINPEGRDYSREWIEIFNASSVPQALSRLTLERLTYTEELDADFNPVFESSSHVLRDAGVLPPHQYIVLADGLADGSDIYDQSGTDAYDYSGGESLGGDLNNIAGGVALRCQGILVDRVYYGVKNAPPAPTEASTLTLTGAAAPDAQLNDESRYWCESPTPTPGMPNAECPFVAVDSCLPDGNEEAERPLLPPTAAGLIISEVFTNPEGSDGDAEWIEVQNPGHAAVDLNRVVIHTQNSLTLGTREFTITETACLPLQVGEFAVIGGSRDAAQNGGVVVDALAVGLSFYNDVPQQVELWFNDTLLDLAVLPSGSEGASLALAPAASAASAPQDANDAPASFCTAGTSGVFAGTGTPGQANICGASCYDGDQNGGGARPAVEPLVGELVITEVFANPQGADDYRDWVEVYNPSGRAIDLNDLVLRATKTDSGSSKSWSIEAATCARLSPGDYAVVAGVGSSADGIAPLGTIDGGGQYLLYGSSLLVQIEKSDGTIIDITASPLDVVEGASLYLGSDIVDAFGNDELSNWCVATVAEPATPLVLGSPGSQNPTCP